MSRRLIIRSLVVVPLLAGLLLGMTGRGVFASKPNNIYGIHLAQPQSQDIQAASDLVNSNGGEWGYATLVIQENDRNREKWQGIFDQLRELHLIPIIRLATQPASAEASAGKPEGSFWRRPEPEDAKDWVNFLDSLNWVVKNRYVILFNEPNHGSEWGGEVDEKSYTKVAFSFAKALKEKNKDFFVMLAGFDASAPSWWQGMEDEEVFIKKILTDSVSEPFPSGFGSQKVDLHAAGTPFPSTPVNIFDYIDGWASHSYPNPGFAGSPYSWGRGTVRTYEWELGLLGRLGVNKELPVFITETGWKRGSEETVAENFRNVYKNVWELDNRVMAVTPFVLDYQGPPFLEFSWKLPSAKASVEQEFYQQYYTVQSLIKTKGEPQQIEKGRISFDLPRELVAQSKYNFRLTLKNQGQAIWDKNESYELGVMSYEGNKPTNFLISDIKDIKPFEEKLVDFSLKTDKDNISQEIKFSLTKNNAVVLESQLWKFKVLPLPDLNLKVNFWPFGKGKGNDFEVQVFDTDDRLVFKKKGMKFANGQGLVKNIQNIAIDELYRIVILKPGYLPRQTFVVFQTVNNLVKFKSLLPFDLNHDGKFDFKDFLKLFK